MLTVEASLNADSSMVPVKVCSRTELRASSSQAAPLCTGITIDCMGWIHRLITNIDLCIPTYHFNF